MKIALFSIFFVSACLLNAQQRHYYLGEDLPADSVFVIDTASAAVALEARCAMPQAKEGRGEGRSWWGVAWDYRSPDDYDYIIMRPFNSDFGSLDDRRLMAVEYGTMNQEKRTVRAVETVASGVNMTKGFNTLLLEWDRGTLNVFAGSKGLDMVMTVKAPLPSSGRCKLISDSRIDVSSVVVEGSEDMTRSLLAGYDMADVMQRLAVSTDPVEGVWSYLDRETDDSRARLGGNYSVIILAADGGYEILYLDGARVNGAMWQPLMIKGMLKATPFERHYNLVWYDSMMTRMDEENHATLSEEGVFSLEFPLYRSRIRLFRQSGAIR